VKWGIGAGNAEEVETVSVVDPVFSGGWLIMPAGCFTSGGDEIWVEDPLEPDLFFKNQAGKAFGYSGSIMLKT
jgi:hypothetical protein